MAIRIATIHMESASPYSACRPLPEDEAKRLKTETPDEHENRTWRKRLNVDAEGNGVIPVMAFVHALRRAAKTYGGKGPGGKMTTWTKHYLSGLLPGEIEGVQLGVTRDSVVGTRLFVPSDGQAGSGKRVWKTFPIVRQWSGSVEIVVVDDLISAEHFAEMFDLAMKFVGVGRWRPENGGVNGRAKVVKVAWRKA